jgi:hypothetical protein
MKRQKERDNNKLGEKQRERVRKWELNKEID